jgi:hypothetical protein
MSSSREPGSGGIFPDRIHMQIAWLNLLTAMFERDGVDYTRCRVHRDV